MPTKFVIICITLVLCISSSAFSDEPIVINALYGGKDAGPESDHYLSKNVTLNIAREIGELLSRNGEKVVYTRDDDSFVELDKRINIPNISRGSIFISIGVNSSKNKSANGVEIYISPKIRSGSNIKIDAQIYSLTKVKPELKEFIREISTNNKYLNSRKAAESINEQINKSNLLNNRGIKNAFFQSVVGPDMPAVLIMVGFMSNSTDRDFLINQDNQKMIGKVIYEGINEYLVESLARE